MKILALIGVFFSMLQLLAQEKLNWQKLGHFEMGTSAVWSADIQGNLYGSSEGKLIKWDGQGKQQFIQSLKKTGTISSISPVNTMKLLVFSEEQQSICFLDNTLSFAEECIDLDGFNIEYATQVAASGQADRFWVFDQVNNTLSLINWNTKQRIVDLLNVSGIVSAEKPIKMIERSNYLFFGARNGIFQFDRFGSLMNAYPQKNLIDFEITDQFILLLTEEELVFIDRRNGYKWSQSKPEKAADGIFVAKEFFYFKNKNTVEKYSYFIQD